MIFIVLCLLVAASFGCAAFILCACALVAAFVPLDGHSIVVRDMG